MKKKENKKGSRKKRRKRRKERQNTGKREIKNENICNAQRQCKAAHVTCCVGMTSSVDRYSVFRPFVVTHFRTITAPISQEKVHSFHAL
jgi:hypothetical protein